MIELRTHRGALPADLRADWELLLDEDPNGTVFHGPRYLGVWASTLGAGTPVRIHSVHRDGRLIGVIPDANDLSGSAEGPEEIRRFQGGTEVTDYLGPVSRREDRYDVADASVANLARDVDWDEFVAGGLADDSGWPDAFRSAFRVHGLQVLEDEREDVCPVVWLPGSGAAYFEQLPGRTRQELTRKTRKLARDAGEIELVKVAADEVVGRLDAFLDQAADAVPEKAGFFRRQDMHDWFKALASEFVDDDVFRLDELYVGGLLAASTVSLVRGGHWGLYNSAFDPSLGSLAPGMVMVTLLIDRAADEGYTQFDLLRGDEAYKYRFGAQDRVLRRLSVARSST